jgi:methionyl-tRNA synthetase
MDRFSSIWPADVHFLGKDILKFHAVIWPAMLMALDLELPRTIFAHGWWTVEGEKMSKSLGNVVDPVDVVRQWGVDAFRYFLLRHVSFGLDGNFSKDQFQARYETDLANELGNLLSRVLSMIKKYNPSYSAGSPDGFDKITGSVIEDLDRLFHDLKFHIILEKIWEVVKFANTYVERSKPWELAKNNTQKLAEVLTNLFEALKVISGLVYPFIPDTSRKMKASMGIESISSEAILEWNPRLNFSSINKGEPLFPKK